MIDRPHQLSLLSENEPAGPPAPREPAGLCREAAQQVYEFALIRLADPAGAVLVSSVENQISTLKHLIRKSLEVGGPGTPLELSLAPEVAARLFREPGRLHRWRVSALWQTFQHFIHTAVEPHEEGARRIDAIDRLLIPRRTKGWYQVERTGGGYLRGGGRDRRLLFAVDLLAIAARARERKGERALRDWSLVALCCWSGLRLLEIVSLRWEQVQWEREPEGNLFAAWARVQRRRRELLLPIHANARGPLADLHAVVKRAVDRTAQGPVFTTLRHPHSQLGLREANDIVREALRRAGLPGASLFDLRAAFSDHLQTTHGLTELDLTVVLGYGEHKHTRRLLEEHRAWRLNQKADAAEARRAGSREGGHREEGRAPGSGPVV